MKNNKCQAFTKKKKPCQNYAIKGSQFCFVHEELFKDFPPSEITALFCPYCDEPLSRGAKFCKFCKNSLLICRYCHEPLRKDSKFCRFCKEDLTPVKPKPEKPNYYRKLINIRNRIAAKNINLSYICLIVVILLVLACFVYIAAIDVYYRITGL
jgi:hypothetical protein